MTVSLVILLIAGAGTIGITRFQSDRFDRTTNDFGDALGVLAALQQAVIELNIPLGEIVYEAPSGTLEESWAQWKSIDRRIRGMFRTAVAADEGSDLRDVLRAVASYDVLGRGVQHARTLWGTSVVADSMAAGSDPTVTSIWTPYLEVQAGLAALSVSAVGAVTIAARHAEERQRAIEWASVAAILLGLCAFAASWRAMSRRVIHPMLQLRELVDRIGEGGGREPTSRLAGASTEISDLATAMNKMAKALDKSQSHLRDQAYTDALTTLANRRSYIETMQEIFEAGREGDIGLVLIDLDDFKDVNDTWGHPAGDELLRIFAQRLRSAVRDGDLVARLGGDEFAVIVREPADGNALLAATLIAERTLALLTDDVTVHGHPLTISCSLGIAEGSGAATPEDLGRHADAAMYMAKGRGKTCFEHFDEGLHSTLLARGDLKRDLRSAARNNELILHYQPIVDLASGAPLGIEALVRWEHPTRGLLQPDEFIGSAEENGSIVTIGEWVLDRALADLASLRRASRRNRALYLTVNVSPRQLHGADLVPAVADALARHGIEPTALILEITEAAFVTDAGHARAVLDELGATGVRIALDDFGTGFSSLQYLAELPVDFIKIDRSFVADSAPGTEGAVVLDAIVALSHSLRIELIAEGIETQDELNRLRALGSMAGQGYLLAKPAPIDVVASLVKHPLTRTSASSGHVRLAG
ncbi:MAG: hypothetical protein QOD30_1576 [Actinomycetota bacterium]|jgi:diguanylate cyclase (GGDEF)-like protein|nr:hypothetical protein [Actinomycetota bacterium]